MEKLLVYPKFVTDAVQFVEGYKRFRIGLPEPPAIGISTVLDVYTKGLVHRINILCLYLTLLKILRKIKLFDNQIAIFTQKSQLTIGPVMGHFSCDFLIRCTLTGTFLLQNQLLTLQYLQHPVVSSVDDALMKPLAFRNFFSQC